MQPYQLRVINERDKVGEELNRLFAFIESDAFNDVDKKEQDLLKRQGKIMEEYFNILIQRTKLYKRN